MRKVAVVIASTIVSMLVIGGCYAPYGYTRGYFGSYGYYPSGPIYVAPPRQVVAYQPPPVRTTTVPATTSAPTQTVVQYVQVPVPTQTASPCYAPQPQPCGGYSSVGYAPPTYVTPYYPPAPMYPPYTPAYNTGYYSPGYNPGYYGGPAYYGGSGYYPPVSYAPPMGFGGGFGHMGFGFHHR